MEALLTWVFLILVLSITQFIGLLMYRSFEKTCGRIKAKFLKMAVKQAREQEPVISASAPVSPVVEVQAGGMPEIKA